MREIMKTGVIDYGAGNLKSVETALDRLGAEFAVSADPDQLRSCERLIFPGVGDAGAAMGRVRERGIDELLRRFAEAGKRILGICLGSQIVLEASEENGAQCLGLIPGTARRFPSGEGCKVPHMGWNRVTLLRQHPLFEGIASDASFYFVHSYYPAPGQQQDIVATTEYIVPFASVISRRSIWAVQFHPEKSGRMGLRMLENFLNAAAYEGEGANA